MHALCRHGHHQLWCRELLFLRQHARSTAPLRGVSSLASAPARHVHLHLYEDDKMISKSFMYNSYFRTIQHKQNAGRGMPPSVQARRTLRWGDGLCEFVTSLTSLC